MSAQINVGDLVALNGAEGFPEFIMRLYGVKAEPYIVIRAQGSLYTINTEPRLTFTCDELIKLDDDEELI